MLRQAVSRAYTSVDRAIANCLFVITGPVPEGNSPTIAATSLPQPSGP
jgi:hypothetical protein